MITTREAIIVLLAKGDQPTHAIFECVRALRADVSPDAPLPELIGLERDNLIFFKHETAMWSLLR